MDTTVNTILTIALGLSVAGFAAYLSWSLRKFRGLESAKLLRTDSIKMQIAAYERLTLLAERTKLTNLVNRLFNNDLNVAQMQFTLTRAISDEFEHNVTQQVYVNPTVWEALKKMKDQNIYIINQLAHLQNAENKAIDLNRSIIDFDIANPQATMNSIVQDAIQHEVKVLMAE